MTMAELETVLQLPPNACIHCGQALEEAKDGDEVCRYCYKAFGSKRGSGGKVPPRCPACAEERMHSTIDMQVVKERIAGMSTNG